MKTLRILIRALGLGALLVATQAGDCGDRSIPGPTEPGEVTTAEVDVFHDFELVAIFVFEQPNIMSGRNDVSLRIENRSEKTISFNYTVTFRSGGQGWTFADSVNQLAVDATADEGRIVESSPTISASRFEVELSTVILE